MGWIAESIEEAHVFCPFTKEDCRSDCALLNKHFEVNRYVCSLALGPDGAYYGPENSIVIRKPEGE